MRDVAHSAAPPDQAPYAVAEAVFADAKAYLSSREAQQMSESELERELDRRGRHSAPSRPARHRLREDAPPPHARPRTLGQGAGADARGTVGPLRDGGRALRLLPARG